MATQKVNVKIKNLPLFLKKYIRHLISICKCSMSLHYEQKVSVAINGSFGKTPKEINHKHKLNSAIGWKTHYL